MPRAEATCCIRSDHFPRCGTRLAMSRDGWQPVSARYRQLLAPRLIPGPHAAGCRWSGAPVRPPAATAPAAERRSRRYSRREPGAAGQAWTTARVSDRSCRRAYAGRCPAAPRRQTAATRPCRSGSARPTGSAAAGRWGASSSVSAATPAGTSVLRRRLLPPPSPIGPARPARRAAARERPRRPRAWPRGWPPWPTPTVFHELVEPAAAQEHFLFAAVQHAREQRLLELEHLQHAFLDGALGHEVDHPHRLLLPQPMHPADALLQHRRVPGQIHVDHHVGVLQVQPDAAGVGGQKQPGTSGRRGSGRSGPCA